MNESKIQTCFAGFALAHLPPGPGGFSFDVNLVYTSSIFDLQTGITATRLMHA